MGAWRQKMIFVMLIIPWWWKIVKMWNSKVSDAQADFPAWMWHWNNVKAIRVMRWRRCPGYLIYLYLATYSPHEYVIQATLELCYTRTTHFMQYLYSRCGMCLFEMRFKWKMFVLEVLVPFQTNTFQWRTSVLFMCHPHKFVLCYT